MKTMPAPAPPRTSSPTRVYLWTLAIGVAVILAVVLVFVVMSSGSSSNDLEQRRTECLAAGRSLSDCLSAG